MQRPNVILVVLDGARFDRFGVAGHRPSPTPTLDALAAQGRTFAETYAAGCPTHFALPALFSSTWPLDEGGYEFGIATRRFALPEAFQAAGYRTVSFAAAPMTNGMWGYDRGFDQVFALCGLPFLARTARAWYAHYSARGLGPQRRSVGDVAAFVAPSLSRLHASLAATAISTEALLRDGQLAHSPLIHEWPFARLHDLFLAENERIESDPEAYVRELAKVDRDTFVERLYGTRLVPGVIDEADALARSAGLTYMDRREVASGAYIVREFGRWLVEHREQRPFFAYLHLMDVHEYAPVTAGVPWDRDLATDDLARALAHADAVREARTGVRAGRLDYDLALRQADARLAELLVQVAAAGVLTNTLIVVTADHGLDAGFPPRSSVSYMDQVDEMYHVPWIVAGPGVPAGTDSRLCSTVDIAPTVLDLAGLATPAEIRGRSLASPDAPARDWVLFEHLGSGPCDPSTMPIRMAVRSSGAKVVCEVPPVTSGENGRLTAVFDLARDPYEYDNLANAADVPADVEALLHVAAERVQDIARQLATQDMRAEVDE